MSQASAPAAAAASSSPSRYRRSIDFIVAATTFSPWFVLPERDPRWQAFLHACPNRDRLAARALRRVGNAIAEARERDICLYCWVPRPACCCSAVRPIVSPELAAAAQPVFLLHHEEFLRVSNSGHVAAIALDAPVVLWGIPQHDKIMLHFGELHRDEYDLFHVVARGAAADTGRGPMDEAAAAIAGANIAQLLTGDAHLPTLEEVRARRVGAASRPPPLVGLLYPQAGATPIDEFIASASAPAAPAPAASAGNDSSPPAVAPAAVAVAAAAGVPSAPPAATAPFVMILLDATWGGAHRLARHIPAEVRRVVINIDNAAFGDGLFVALRKRTRETGCSTLEATALALRQLLLARYPTNAPFSAAVSQDLLWSMALFVDLVKIVMHVPENDVKKHVYSTDPEIVAILDVLVNGDPARGGGGLRQYWVERQHAVQRDREQASVQQLLAGGYLRSPLLRFCYVCHVYVPASRQIAHCAGAAHMKVVDEKLAEAKKAIAAASDAGAEATPERLHELAVAQIWKPNDDDRENQSLPFKREVQAAAAAAQAAAARANEEGSDDDDG